LDQFVSNYNNTPHRSIGMAPVDVTPENRDQVYKRLYPTENLSVVCRLKVGDRVRKILEKNIFQKGYEQSWSDEIYKIKSVRQSNQVCYYTISDLEGEKLSGIWYYYQLNLVSHANQSHEKNK